VSGQLVRRLRLPPEVTSPGIARAAIVSVVAEAGLRGLSDTVQLLTSELVTNAVMHAGTELELEILVDGDGITVVVTDFASVKPSVTLSEGPPGGGVGRGGRAYAQLDEAQPAEGGRGLLLVSLLATRWGTSHQPGGHQVWFQLDRTGLGGSPEERTPMAAPPRRAPAAERILETLAGDAVPPTPAELLRRVVAAMRATTATITVDRGDERGSWQYARYTSAAAPAVGGRTVRVPVPVTSPWQSELTVTGAQGRHTQAVAGLAANQIALLIENQRLQEAHNERRGWLVFLAEAGELLAHSLDVDLTIALIPRLVVPRLGRWGAVHVANEYGEVELAALAHEDESALPTLSEQLDAALPEIQRALLADGVVALAGPTDSIACPLSARGERVGTLTIGRRGGAWQGSDELAIIEDLCRRVAFAMDNSRIHQNSRRITATLQQSLLPPMLPHIDGLDVAAQYVPAGDGLDVGGDFYDVVPLAQDGWMLVLGDVSGKGVGAAAVTGLVRDVLHALALDYREPQQTLNRLNETLVQRGGGYFCTLALAFLTSVKPGDVELSLHLAGHDQPILLRADGTASMVGSLGTALGLVDTIQAPRTTVRLNSGDSLIFYTDGVTERRNGTTLYGHQHLLAQVSSLAGLPAAVLASHLRASVLGFSPQQPRDDIAIVALRAP
jgi:sigma-B regulation protein RsbU (phosphoserine phosphatase)